MTSGGREIPGNSLGSQLEYQRQLIRLAESLLRFETVADSVFDRGDELMYISCRLKGSARSEYLLVLKARIGGVPVVSFHAAETLAEALRGLIARVENGSVKWKVDEYG